MKFAAFLVRWHFEASAVIPPLSGAFAFNRKGFPQFI
jgi:hypothetical protein